MASELPPTYYFTDITFNPSFYTSTTTSNYLTLETAKNIFLTYPAAQGTETITTLNSSTINTSGPTLSIGANGTSNSTIVIGSDTNAQTTVRSSSIGFVASNTTVTGNLSTSQANYSNSYNFTGTTPTLTRSSLGYYVNYAQNSLSFSSSNKFLYAPGSNNSSGEAHYLNAGVYMANIHLCVVAAAGQTYSGRFSLGVSAGTNIQAMPANSQYGIMNIESLDITALNTGVSLAGNFSTYSHSGCFTLTSNNFVNLELNLKAQTGAAMTFYLYGCIHRIA